MVNNPTHYSGIRSEGRIESTPQGVLVGLVDSLPSASVAGAGTVVLVKGTGKFHVSNGSAWTEQKLVATSSADKVTVNTTLQNDSNAVAGSVVYALKDSLEDQIGQVESSIPDDTVTTAQMNTAAGDAKTSAVSESKSYTDAQLGLYYKKTEIDSEVAALENKISAIPKFTMSVVSSLPTTGDSATLYIVGTAGSDSAKEYIYVNNAWELIGDIRITVADAVAQNNGNPVSSGAVYTALQDYLPVNGKAKDSEKADHATSADTATSATNATNATTAGSATKATQDASGNIITSTYATKTELSNEVSSLNSAINTVSQSVEGKMDDTPVDDAPTSGSTNLVTSGGVYDAINTKQDAIVGGTGITIGNDGKTINHSNSVSAQTSYVGSATAVPRLMFDAQGHITGVTTATIYPPTTAGTAGQVWTSDGSGVGSWKTPDTGSSAPPVTEVSGIPLYRYIRSGLASPSAVSATISWNANSSVIGSKGGTLHVAYAYQYSSSYTYTSTGSLTLTNSQLLSGMIWVALGASGTVYTGSLDSDLYDSRTSSVSDITITVSITV